MNIKNQKEFFENIQLNDDGVLQVKLNSKAIPVIKTDNQYATYKKIILTQEGYLQISEK